MARLTWLLPAAILCAGALAGCVTPLPSLPEGCDPRLFKACPAEGAWQIRDFDVQCREDDQDSYGLNAQLGRVGRAVVLENFSFRSCHHPLVLWGCESCELVLRNGYVANRAMRSDTPSEDAGLALGDRAAILLLGTWQRVAIQNVTIVAQDAFNGIHARSEGIADFAIDGVHITSPERDSRTTGLGLVTLDPRMALCASRVHVSGFGVGALLQASNLTVSRANVSDNEFGLIAGGVDVRIEDSSFEANTVSGLALGTGRLRHRDPHPPPAQLARLRVTGSEYGIHLMDADSAAVSATMAEGNRIGLMAGPEVVVRASSFTGNTEAAVAPNLELFDSAGNRVEPSPVDAAGNWWGAATGPSLQAEGVRLPGAGDPVAPGVVYTPFLGEPPAGVGPQITAFSCLP